MGYRVVSLGDVIQLEDSKRQPLSSSERYNRSGVYPYYGAQGIVDYLDDYTYEGDYLLVAEDGENLRSRKQPIANAAHGRFRVNNHAHVIAATKCCNLIYLRHLLNSMDIAAYVTGSTQPKLSQTSLLNMKVERPEIDKQDAIAAFLHCFDAKITANAKLNGYLEELLLAKYDKLFPVNADFTGILSDIGTVIGGATPSKKRSEYYCSNGIGWITPRDLSNTGDKFIAHGTDDITDEGYASCSAKLLPEGSVLFSSRAPIGYVAIATDELATNQGFKSVVPKEEIGTAFVYCFLVRNKQRIADMGAGTTFPEVSGKMMKSVELAVPKQTLCAEFSFFAEPILKQQEAFERENRELAALRDALLPKLLSGEIDVSKIDLTQLNSHLS